MDVPAAASPAPPIASASAVAVQPVPPAPVAEPGTPSSSGSAVAATGGGGTSTSTVSSLPPAPAKSSPGSPASNQQTDNTLSPVVAKLFNASEQNVEVSFQVLHNPDEVVTVFTDRSTGQEIVQFPSQALIALAEMYDKDAGNVLDKSV